MTFRSINPSEEDLLPLSIQRETRSPLTRCQEAQAAYRSGALRLAWDNSALPWALACVVVVVVLPTPTPGQGILSVTLACPQIVRKGRS